MNKLRDELAECKGSVIAKRGDSSYLVDLGEGKGYVLSPDTIGNETVMDIHAIIKFGYWEEYEDGETVQEIKQRFKEEIPSDSD